MKLERLQFSVVLADDQIAARGAFQDQLAPDAPRFLDQDIRVLCDDLLGITLPAGLETIGDSAFFSCDGFTEISLPDSLLSIGNKAFSGCTGFTEITFPQNLKRIGYSAFADCANITTLYLPASLEEIGRDAFLGCGELFFTVERDSYAAQYARDNNIEFTYSDINAWLNG